MRGVELGGMDDEQRRLRTQFAELQRAHDEAWRQSEEDQAEFFRLESMGRDTSVASARATESFHAWNAAHRAMRSAADEMIDHARKNAGESADA